MALSEHRPKKPIEHGEMDTSSTLNNERVLDPYLTDA
jgi:hypothetical protein